MALVPHVRLPPAVLYRELKTDRGRLSRVQREWLALLSAAGADACLWRPADWPVVERALAAPVG